MSFRSSVLTKSINFNVKEMEAKIKKAKVERKIFIILGRYDTVRRCLLLRNWLEKVPDDQLSYITPATERLVIALLLKPFPFHFIWQPRNRPIKSNDSVKPFINSIRRQRVLDFTAKDGLTNCAHNFQWNFIENVTDLNYPRTYILSEKQTKDEFAEEFRRTAFTSFISFLNTHINFRDLFSEEGEINTETIDFCIQKLELLIKIDSHDDIDTSRVFDICAKFPRNQKKILAEMRQIINGVKKFHLENEIVVDDYKTQVKICATKVLEKWPHLKYDGHKNIWILKPIGWSSGSGVVLLNDDEKIKSTMSASSITYVAQKYIERPMIIHERKFDIRIYFMTFISKGSFNVWLYKDCYIKFATEPFNLENFNKSIHVTNYAVQKYFMNDHKAVPNARENMWPLEEFIKYVGTIEKPRLWEAKLYPAIKKNLLAVILASLEVTEMEPNNFELNGADFMIGFDHEPLLLEVNSVPALFFSKVVIDMITNRLLEDVVKVVVDYSKDPTAFTGDFELIHTEEIPKVVSNEELPIVGRKINKQIDRQSFKEFVMKQNSMDAERNERVIQSMKHNTSEYVYLKDV